jgi:hypothetical protein
MGVDMLYVELLPLVVDACYQPEIVPANINRYPPLGSAVLEQVDVLPKNTLQIVVTLGCRC